jgi:hypothetical protein
MAKFGEEGVVYILKDKNENHIKIGHTINTIWQRYLEIRRKKHIKRDLFIVTAFYFNNCRKAEREIHDYLKIYALGHEMFDCTVEQASEKLLEMGGVDSIEWFLKQQENILRRQK